MGTTSRQTAPCTLAGSPPNSMHIAPLCCLLYRMWEPAVLDASSGPAADFSSGLTCQFLSSNRAGPSLPLHTWCCFLTPTSLDLECLLLPWSPGSLSFLLFLFIHLPLKAFFKATPLHRGQGPLSPTTSPLLPLYIDLDLLHH